jgi:ribonuclease-3
MSIKDPEKNLMNIKKYVSGLNLSITDDLLIQTFTHPSNKSLDASITDYNALEFLGDAVLNLLVTEWIFNKFDIDEGSLTVSRSNIVNNKILSKIGRKLGIDQLIIIPDHYKITDGDIADCFEALIGVIYLQHGFINCQTFFHEYISEYVNQSILTTPNFMQINAINQMQEYFQKKQMTIPEPKYKKTGPDNSPLYYCFYNISINNSEISVQGIAGNKKDAKKRAAEELLNQLAEIDKTTI